MATQNSVNNSLGTTAYAVICGGTTATGPVQPIASVGTATQILTSNGAGALPTFQTNSTGLIFIDDNTASSSSEITFTSIGSYSNYVLVWNEVRPATDDVLLALQMSNDNGSSWVTSGYLGGCTYCSYNSATMANSNVVGGAAWALSGTLDNASSSNFSNGTITIYNMNTGNSSHISGTVSFYNNTASTARFGTCGGISGSTGGNALRLSMTSGNIAAGVFRLYGVRNS